MPSQSKQKNWLLGLVCLGLSVAVSLPLVAPVIIKRMPDCLWKPEWWIYSTVGQTPLPGGRLGTGEARSRLQDSWATGHTVIQVITLCQRSLSKKKADWHFLALWSALRMWGWKLAWLSPSLGKIVEVWEFDSLIMQNISLVQHRGCCFAKAKTQSETQRIVHWSTGLTCLHYGCVIQGQPKSGRKFLPPSSTH